MSWNITANMAHGDGCDFYTVTVTKPIWDLFGEKAKAALRAQGVTVVGSPKVLAATVQLKVQAPKDYKFPSYAGITVKKD